MAVPDLRIRAVNGGDVRAGGDFVLYWMIANRRLGSNFALDRALEWCAELGKPLFVLEALRCDYPWASDRLHAFVLQGMAANQARAAKAPITYYPYVEPRRGAGKGLLAALAERAAVVVTDDFPCFFLPRMVEAAGEALAVKLEAVDSNGILPIRAAERSYTTAYSFRRYVQKTIPWHLEAWPVRDPLAKRRLTKLGVTARAVVPRKVSQQWPQATAERLTATQEALADLPIDHAVRPAATRGGSAAARERLARFVDERCDGYLERNQPAAEVTSGLSPYLHFGHISAHEVFDAVTGPHDFSIDQLPVKASGKREGWWDLPAPVEGFLDQLITWRELGYGFCAFEPEYASYAALPDFAKETLAVHGRDPRPYTYDVDDFEAAATHDDIWNAAQRELVATGHMHNYLRMLWGKLILNWSATPQAALSVMIHLNNKYALDGRNPNSYSGIFWTLGRFDRGWPERAVFGKIRCMTSASTKRKLDLKAYLARWGKRAAQPGLFGDD